MMAGLAVFAATLLVATLLSSLAHRTVLSAAVLFLLVGYAIGPSGVGMTQVRASDLEALRLVEYTLFAVLFTDGMRLNLGQLRGAWHTPARALFVGTPLTLLATATLAWLMADLGWREAALVGAILAPTDPVFAAGLVERKDVQPRLRQLLNVESGLNDGLILPVIATLVHMSGAGTEGVTSTGPRLAAEVTGGVVLGLALPWAASRLERSRLFSLSEKYQPVFAVAVALLLLAIAELSRANLYLAAFTAGVTLGTLRPELARAFSPVGDTVAEVLKLAAVLTFGAILSAGVFQELRGRDLAFAAAALFIARPLALGLALGLRALPRRELTAALWFGPRGFASVVFGLLVLHSRAPQAGRIFDLTGLVVAASMLLHSSTDVLVARWLRRSAPDQGAA
jgi:NhaP-type Na+/H+ or K+/H+ antiporter